MHQVIIIGAGPAGMTAAIYCVRKGLDTLVIGKDVGGQVAKSAEIANYLGVGQSTGADLAVTFHKHVEGFENIQHRHGINVTDIKKLKKGFEIVTTGAESFQTETIIIATGRSPRHLNIPGEAEYTNKGVSYCDVCDGPLFKGKDVAIIGGGNTAMEAAISMSALSPKVYLVTITSKLTGDDVLSQKIDKIKNIEVITDATTKRIVGETFVTGAIYRDKNDAEHALDVKGVFIEVGYVPASEFVTLTTKDKQNRIVIDENCNTDVEGVFAAGDVTSIRDNQIVIAAGEGAKAALSAFYYLARK